MDRRAQMVVYGVLVLLVLGLAAVLAGGAGWISGFGRDTDAVDPSPIAAATAPATAVPSPTPMPTATPSPTPTPTPPPTPTPTPTPSPQAFSQCYQPRPAAAPVSTPGVSATPTTTLAPAAVHSIFQRCQVVAYYGYPGEPLMGILGEYDPATVIQKLREQIVAYQQASPERQVIPALHIIYAVAQANPTDDGTWLYRMPDELVQEYIKLAEDNDLLLFLDIQMGHSTVSAELKHVLPYLENPRVHLALDPEFAVPPEDAPGEVIGGMDASSINEAQIVVQQFVQENNMTNKILMIHQFNVVMIRDKEQLRTFDGVDLVIDVDGFGWSEDKIAGYERYVHDEGAPHGGFKLFYKQDSDLMTPEQVEALTPQPDVIIYQ